VNAALELGVGHLVAERPQRRRFLHPLQEIRPAAPVAREERPLKDHLGALGQCGTGGLGVLGQIAARNLDDLAPLGLQPRQMRGLMRVALFLQQFGVLAVGARLRPLTAQAHQVKRRRVPAAHEPHEVGCRKQQLPVQYPHANSR